MTEVAPRHPFVERFVNLAEALPVEIELPEDLTQDDFKRLLAAMHTVHHRSGIYWGILFRKARERFGQEAYQLFDWTDYAESTLQNYARLSEQIHPSLWNEKLPTRHMQAIGQNVDDPDEQKRWVKYAQENGVSGDQLRMDIHEDQERRGTRPKAEKAVWIECECCHGRGGRFDEQQPR